MLRDNYEQIISTTLLSYCYSLPSDHRPQPPPQLLCAAGFRFAPVALSRADERCVFELGLRMRMHDGHSVRGAITQVRPRSLVS